MNLATLFARIGIDTGDSSKKAQNFLDQLKGIKIGLGIATISVAAFSYGIKKLMDDAIQTSFALRQFNTETGLSTDKLQRWQSVADEVNNSGKAVAESIKAIVSNQEKIKLGQGNISGYQLLGIDPRQNAFKILEQLREKTKGLSQGMKKNILEQMGISKELIQVLELSKKKFDAMAKGAFIIPKGAIDLIDKARASSKQLGSAINYLKAMIAANLTPSIIKINKEIMKWIRQNQQGIIKTVKTIFYWITKFTGAIINAVKMINQIITSTVGWKNAMIALVGILAILNASLLVSPIGIFVAGIILLIAILDDLYMYSKGKKSLFGVLMERFPELDKKIKSFTENLQNAFGLVKNLFKGDETGIEAFIKKMGNLGKGIVAIFETIRMIFKFTTFIFTQMLRPIQFLIDIFPGLMKLFNVKTVGKGIKEIQEAITKHGENVWGDVEKLGKAGKQSIKTISKVFNIKVEINSKAEMNEEELAKKVDETLQRSFNNADENLGGED